MERKQLDEHKDRIDQAMARLEGIERNGGMEAALAGCVVAIAQVTKAMIEDAIRFADQMAAMAEQAGREAMSAHAKAVAAEMEPCTHQPRCVTTQQHRSLLADGFTNGSVVHYQSDPRD